MKPRIRKILRSISVLLLLAALGFSFYISRGVEDFRILPYKTQISIRSDAKSAFLTDDEVFSLLPFKSTDSAAIAIKPHQLETLLVDKSPFIRKAQVFISPSSKTLNVRVDQRHPILTIYNGDQAYYLDSEGKIITSRVGTSAYVPVAVGNLSKEIVVSTLLPIAKFLQENSEWSTFFSLIDVQSESRIHLYPRVGDFVFEIDGTDHFEEDFNKIPIFYKKIVPKVGVDKYKVIKISYKDQIVCQLRDSTLIAQTPKNL